MKLPTWPALRIVMVGAVFALAAAFNQAHEASVATHDCQAALKQSFGRFDDATRRDACRFAHRFVIEVDGSAMAAYAEQVKTAARRYANYATAAWMFLRAPLD